MFLIIISLVILFISTFYVYETAKKNGRNAVIWTFSAIFAAAGTYLFLFIVFGIIISIGIANSAWTMDGVQTIGEMIHMIILALSIGSVMLILLQVGRKKDNGALSGPPPPPTFEDDN